MFESTTRVRSEAHDVQQVRCAGARLLRRYASAARRVQACGAHKRAGRADARGVQARSTLASETRRRAEITSYVQAKQTRHERDVFKETNHA